MIVRILSHGKSFKGLAAYLTHDPDAKTNDRVGWSHTLNLANDFVPAAVDEMLWTARAADLLKQEAGIRGGGRQTENVVAHLSLNWAPDEDPSRSHMIETSRAFLQHMGWDEHQAIIVAHEDKVYSHVHLMINRVHPETGLCLKDDFEFKKAQAWALDYEREQGRIYCEQRLVEPEQREDAPTRPAWMALRDSQIKFEREENALRENNNDFSDNAKISDDAAWKKLKEIQRDEREAFFTAGKSEFIELRKSIFRGVREEFRSDWADYYARVKSADNSEDLAEMKTALLAEQNAVLIERRDEACQELRAARDDTYRLLLDDQMELRHGLHARQHAGLDNELFFDALDARTATAAFKEAAVTLTEPREAKVEPTWQSSDEAEIGTERKPFTGMKSEIAITTGVAEGVGFGLLSLFEGIADGLVGGKADPKPRAKEPEAPRPALFEVAAADARRRQQEEELLDAHGDARKRQRSYWE